MISKLEREFFETFNITPLTNCKKCGASRVALGLCAEVNCDVVYPDITDTILLKLICLCFRYDNTYKGQYYDVAQIKGHVLYRLIMIYHALTTEPWLMPHIYTHPKNATKLMIEIEQIFRP